MDLPLPQGQNRLKPLSFDPDSGRFQLIDDLIGDRERLYPIESLSAQDIKRLVIERLRVGPDFTMQAISGPPYGRDELIRAIEADEPVGQMTVAAETAYLRDYQAQLRAYLVERAG